MLLAIDIGNTNVVFGVFAGEALEHTFRVSASRERTADEYAVLLRELLRARSINPAAITATIIASVCTSILAVIVMVITASVVTIITINVS